MIGAFGLAAAPSASALPKVGEQGLWVRSEHPIAQQLLAQMAALNNPDVADGPKRANIYDPNGTYKSVIDVWFRYVRSYKQGDVTWSTGTPQQNGATITMRVKSTAKGYGSFDEKYFWQKHEGRWKYDVIRWCRTSASCPGKNLV
jgi:hypothetical protein